MSEDAKLMSILPGGHLEVESAQPEVAARTSPALIIANKLA